jgi:hypothetical protein
MGEAPDPSVEILTRHECLSLLRDQSFGRVGASIDALPVILPVHFTLFEESVLFRTVPGTKFDAATVGAVLAFQADAYDLGSGTGWSVLLQGLAAEVADDDGPELAASGDIPRWVDDGPDGRLVRIDATQVNGRQFRLPGATSPAPDLGPGPTL